MTCQRSLVSNPSTYLDGLEKKAHKTWLTLVLPEEKFLHQRARVKWIESGDSNSNYFHRLIATRQATNQIHYLINQEGNKIENIKEVQDHCVEYFKDLLGGESPSLSEAEK